MIKITINGKKYKGCYSWDDLTLSRFCDLAAIPIPDGYKDFIIADGKFTPDNQKSVDEYVEAVTAITEDQLNIQFPEYYRKVIYCLSNIPQSIQLPDNLTHDLYEFYFKPFVVSILYHTPLIHFYGELKQYEPNIIRSFNIGLQKFYLPQAVNVMGQNVPLKNESILTYAEASDVFRGMKLTADDINKLALFMAIYCRKRGEEYDERNVLQRKDLFMKAPMSVVWSVFFCIIRRLPSSMSFSLLSGNLRRSLRESVSEVRTYRGMEPGGLSLKLQNTEA